MTRQEFWGSFEQQMPALELLISGKSSDLAGYNALSENLQAFNKYLIPEITMDQDNHYILIISCDGNREGIPAIERLMKDMKAYPDWRIIKYRQPGPMEFIPLLEQKVHRKDILLTWKKMPDEQYLITFYLKWYLNNKTQQVGAILHMDHTLGEYDAMTRIHDAQFKSLRLFQSKKGLKTLDDLKAEIDAK
jgi:hypothetical protein